MLRNIWFWGCLVLLATNGIIAALWWNETQRRTPTRVLRVTPERLADVRSPLRVTFSRPMTPDPTPSAPGSTPSAAGFPPSAPGSPPSAPGSPPSAPGSPPSAPGSPPNSNTGTSETGTPRDGYEPLANLLRGVTVTPALDLDARWLSPTTLEIVPRTNFERATPYTLALSGALLDADGYPLDGDSRHKFTTPSLQVLHARQVGLSRDWALSVEVRFNDAVALSTLRTPSTGAAKPETIEFTDVDGKPVPMRCVTEGDTADLIVFESNEVRREKVKVRVAEGLAGVSGPLPLANDAVFTVDVSAGLVLQHVHERLHDVDDGSLRLAFSHQVAPEVLADYLRIEPAVRHSMQRNRNTITLRGEFRPHGRYKILLRRGLPTDDGRFLADDVERSVRMPGVDPAIGFLGEGEYLTQSGSRELLLRTVNVDEVKLKIERIFPNNIVHYLNGASHVGTQTIKRQNLAVQGGHDTAVITTCDLEALVGDWRGPLSITARTDNGYWPSARRRVTMTDLGIHVKVDRDGLLVWVLRLSDLSPVAGASVAVLSRKNQELHRGTTGADGTVRLNGDTPNDAGSPFVVTAIDADEKDFSYLRLRGQQVSRSGLDVGGRPFPDTPVEAFVYAQRGVIRPGESIHLRALLRDRDGKLPEAGMPLEWEILRPDGNRVELRQDAVSEHGTSRYEWASERYLPTGLYHARVRIPGEDGAELGRTRFRVEDFLPETLRVHIASDERRIRGGESLAVDIRAEHLFGGDAKGLLVKAECDLVQASFTHEAYEDYVFGGIGGTLSSQKLPTVEGQLDAAGKKTVKFTMPADADFPTALRAIVRVSVYEPSGRAVSVRLTRDVDPVPFYLGARRLHGTIAVGEKVRLEAAAVQPDGTPSAHTGLTAHVLLVTWDHSLQKDRSSGVYRWQSERREELVFDTELVATDGKATLDFVPKIGGRYEVRFAATRSSGKPAIRSKTSFTVEGGAAETPLEIPQRIVLTPDRPHYNVGDVARLRVEAPITGAALLATETDRVHEHRTFRLEKRNSIVEVPVTSDLAPHGYVTLTVVRSSLASASRGVPIRAYGAVALLRDPAEAQAEVELTAPSEVRPGKPLDLELVLRRSDGTAANAEVAVALVDAGILSLTSFTTPDPLSFFTKQRALGTRSVDLFSHIVPEPNTLIAKGPSETGGGGGNLAGLLNPVQSNRVRSVALWVDNLRTDATGRITTRIDAPDFDGELVAMVVASGQATVGSTEARIKIRRPVVLQPSLPRFLAPGDELLAPLTLHNTTHESLDARITLTTEGGVRIQDGADGQRVVPLAGDENKTIWFPLRATDVGEAKVSWACDTGSETYTKAIELPVRPASPPAVEATDWIVRGVEAGKGRPRELSLAREYLPSTLESQLVLSTGILPGFEGSLRYLLEYPYGCVEQTTSKLIPWLTLKEYLQASDDDEYSDEEIQDHVQGGIARLFGMQTGDGGLSSWPRGHSAYRYGSLYAAWVLLAAKEAGYSLPEKHFERLLDYIDASLKDPRDQNVRQAATTRAYALAVLAKAGRLRPHWLATLYERREELGAEGRAHLAVAAAYHRESLPGSPLADVDAQKSPAANNSEPERQLGGFLYSRTRELCYVISALIDLERPREELLPYVRVLRERRENGRYRSTHEDGLVLYTVGRLSRLLASNPGPANVWVRLPNGEEKLVQVTDRTTLPIEWTRGGKLSLAVEGTDAVYAYLESRGVPVTPAGGTTKAPTESDAPTRFVEDEYDRGLAVRRRFLRPDGSARPPGAFRQGETLLVELELDAQRRLANVVVVDPLPAGLEIENPRFANAAKSRAATAHKRLRPQGYEMRDDRFLLFVNAPAGKSRYRYLARAVTEGEYVLPPVAAECMYDSSVRSVHGRGRIEVTRRKAPQTSDAAASASDGTKDPAASPASER